MKWLIDIGNSYCKSAFFQSGEILDYSCIKTAEIDSLANLATRCAAPIESVWVASVAGLATDKKVAALFAQQLGIDVRFVQVDVNGLEIKTRYRTDQLGVDRFVSLLAAWDITKRSCVVVDCGTATTIDYIDGEGCHLGGVIFPSLQTSYLGLHHATDRLPDMTAEHAEGFIQDVFATDTESAMMSGCHTMLLTTVEHIIQRMWMAEDADAVVLFTGGLGEMICKRFKGDSSFVADLSIKGIAIWSERG